MRINPPLMGKIRERLSSAPPFTAPVLLLSISTVPLAPMDGAAGAERLVHVRTCIHNHRTPPGQVLCCPAALKNLDIRQDSCVFLPCRATKSLAHPASAGYEYRF